MWRVFNKGIDMSEDRKKKVKDYVSDIKNHQCPDCKKKTLEIKNFDGEKWVVCNSCSFDAIY